MKKIHEEFCAKQNSHQGYQRVRLDGLILGQGTSFVYRVTSHGHYRWATPISDNNFTYRNRSQYVPLHAIAR